MENFKLWALSLCGALVVTSIFRILMSDSHLKKSINIFLSMFIFLYSVIPLGEIFASKSLTLNSREETTLSYDDFYKKSYEKIIEKAIGDICENNDVSVISIDFNSYIDENEYYCVKSIFLKINNSEKAEQIKNEINNAFGFEVEVS